MIRTVQVGDILECAGSCYRIQFATKDILVTEPCQKPEEPKEEKVEKISKKKKR